MPKADWGGAGVGAASGAASGAAVGSVVPVLGTAIGAVGGGILGGLAGLFGGKKKPKEKKVSLLTKEQEEMNRYINEALTQGTGPLADLFGKFNEEEFNKGVRDPALKNFKESILPQIQEKFIAGGQVGGSGSIRGQTKGATDLQSDLDKLKFQAQQQQKQNQIAGIGTVQGQRNFENTRENQPQSAISGFSQGVLSSAGQATGNWINNKINPPATPAPAAPAQVAQPVAG